MTGGDGEGRRMALGIFPAGMRSGLGEALSVPRSRVPGNVARNRSPAAQGDGRPIDVPVAIGHDTPGRRAHATLPAAVRRSRGIPIDRGPRGHPCALSDINPECRPVGRWIPPHPGARRDLIGALNAGIQDVFNECGVRVMSLHCIDDGEQSRVVPPERRNPSPAGPARRAAAGEGGR